ALRYDDHVYRGAIRPTWDYLNAYATAVDGTPVFDFGIAATSRVLSDVPPPPEAAVRIEDAPMLMPAHLQLLAQTAPIPAIDPDVAMYLHGPQQQPDAVTVVWRADMVAPDSSDVDRSSRTIRRQLLLMPPRASEAIGLPVWTVKRWLAA